MRSVAEARGKLTIILSNETAGREAGYRSSKPVIGAFDAQADFAEFAVTAAGADEGWGGIRFRISDNDLAEIKRAKTGSTDRVSARIVIEGTTYSAGADSSAAAGKFRIKRDGMGIFCQYDVGAGWVILLSKPDFSTSLGKLSLLAGVAATGIDAAISFLGLSFYESPNSIYEDHVPKGTGDENDGGVYPIQVTRKGHREYKNRINVQYTKRDKDYVQGVAMADDIVDIDKFGLQDGTMQLDGFCIFSRASKMGWLFLRKGLMNPQTLDFKLGPQSLGCAPGDVRFISDQHLELSARGARILNISEGPEYAIEVSAVEEDDFSDLASSGSDTSEPGEIPSLRGDPGSAVRLAVYEIPSLYARSSTLGVSFSRPSNEAWAGSALFEAYAAAGDYTFKESKTKNGITGVVYQVGRDGDAAFVTVDLDYDYTLESLAGIDALLQTPGKNSGIALTGSGNKVFRYQTVSLVSPRRWKLTGLFYDLAGFPSMNSYGAIAAADILILDTPYQVPVPDVDKFRALYFKLASANFAGELQPLADLGSVNITPQALSDKPLPPWGIKVGDYYLDASLLATQEAGDIVLAWSSRNRFGDGIYVYDRADAPTDDADFKNFILEIYQGETLLRTVTQNGKSFTYTTAMQTTDGGPFSAYTFKLKQEGNLAFSDQVIFAVNTV
jgi:hypothetical protein